MLTVGDANLINSFFQMSKRNGSGLRVDITNALSAAVAGSKESLIASYRHEYTMAFKLPNGGHVYLSLIIIAFRTVIKK